MNQTVSIVMSAYNAEKHIKDAIQSVLKQTYTDWQLHIVDDCSTDSTREIIQSFAQADERIHVTYMPKNSGAGVCRNKAIEQTQGRYIAFLDSDDQWLPTKLEKQIRLMQEKQCGAVYSSYFVCDAKGKINGWVKCRSKETAFSIKCDDKMGNLTFMYDETITGKVYMPAIRKRQDWVHKMNILDICKVAYGIKEPLAIYRHSAESISRNKLGLVHYNIAGYRQLGWSKYKANAFFWGVFLPTHFSKRLINRIRNNQYHRYL